MFLVLLNYIVWLLKRQKKDRDASAEKKSFYKGYFEYGSIPCIILKNSI